MLQKNQYNRFTIFNILSKGTFILCFVVLLISITGLRAFCQHDTIILKEIEVVGLKPEISTQSPNPLQQLTIKKLESIPTTSVAEAIRNFTGVVVKDYGGVGGLKTVMIRSLGANHTSVFVDGLPNNDNSTGQIDLGRISLNDVGNIQLSVGQPEFDLMSATMYASAGVLDIRSKDPGFGSGKSVVNIASRAGSFGTFNPSLGVDFKWSENVSTGMKINYYSAKGNFPYEMQNGSLTTKLERQNSDIQSADGLFKTKIVLPDSSIINFKATYYHSDRGLPGAVIFYNTHSSQHLKNNDLVTGLQYRIKPGKRISMMVSAGLCDYKLLYTDPDFQNQTGGIRNEYNQQQFYLSDAVQVSLTKGLKFSLATDVIISSLSTNAYSVNRPRRTISYTAAAIKYERTKTEIQASILLTAARDKSEGLKDIEFLKMSPAISVVRAINNDRTLKARFSYKSTYRLPTFNDLYYLIAGNNKLQPESASMCDLGLLYSKAFNNNTGVNIRLDGFINNVKNKIVTLPTQNLFIWSTVNIGKVDIKGIELSGSLTRHFSKNWSVDLSANYTYQEALDVTDKEDNNFRHQIAYIPYETAGFLATSYYRHFSFGVNTLFNGFRYATGDNMPANLLDKWTTTDITLSWQSVIKEQLLKVKAEAVNVFGKQYEVIRGFPMTGSGYYLNLYLTIK